MMSYKAKSFIQESPSILANWVFILSLVGYSLVAGISVYFEFPNRFISVPFRGVVLVLSISIIFLIVGRFIIISQVERENRSSTNLFWLCWWSFWLLYLSRIWLDFAFNEEALKIPAWEYFLYAAGVSLIPASALAFRNIECIGKNALSIIVFLGTLSLLFNLWLIYLQQGFREISDFTSNRVETETLNPISIGQIAVTVIILSLWALLSRRQMGKTKIIVFIGCIAISMGGLIASVSRGPVIALVIVIPFLLYASGVSRGWLSITILCCIAISGIATNVDYFSEGGNLMIIDRMRFSAFDDIERSRLLSEGLNVFMKNPLLGGGIEPLSTYPHNLILESFMVCGILSGVCFSYLLFYSVWVSSKLLKLPNCWASFLLIQYTISAMLSGSLYSSNALWVLMAIVVGEVGRRYSPEEMRQRMS